MQLSSNSSRIPKEVQRFSVKNRTELDQVANLKQLCNLWVPQPEREYHHKPAQYLVEVLKIAVGVSGAMSQYRADFEATQELAQVFVRWHFGKLVKRSLQIDPASNGNVHATSLEKVKALSEFAWRIKNNIEVPLLEPGLSKILAHALETQLACSMMVALIENYHAFDPGYGDRRVRAPVTIRRLIDSCLPLASMVNERKQNHLLVRAARNVLKGHRGCSRIRAAVNVAIYMRRLETEPVELDVKGED